MKTGKTLLEIFFVNVVMETRKAASSLLNDYFMKNPLGKLKMLFSSNFLKINSNLQPTIFLR
jgi:hypothetical protein